MATETQDPPVTTEKVYDIEKQQYVDKPVEPVVHKEQPPPMGEKKEEPETPETPTEEKKQEETPPGTGEGEKKPETTFEPGSYIKEKWGEKYGLESEQDIQEILESSDDLVKKSQELTAKVAELEKKAAEPVYRTEQEKKIAEFLKPYDPSRFGEGLNTVASIIAMDPSTASQTRVLEEAYIIKHPDLTREEAQELFKYEFNNKYVLDKDNFDSDEKYNQQKRILDIQLKNEEAQARKELSAKKEELKAVPVRQEEKKPDEPVPTAPKEAVEAYTKDIEKFFNPEKNKVFDRFNFMSDDGKEVLAAIVLDAEKVAAIKDFAKEYISNPAFYGKDGKISNFTPQELVRSGARILYGDWMEDQLWKQVKIVAGKLKAEQIAGQTPEKKSTGGGDAKLSVDDQFVELAKKAAASRQR